MSALLSAIKTSELVRLLDFDSPDSSYCSPRDQARGGRQHIESLAVIFSGSQNKGVSYCSEDHNPFRTESEGRKSGKGSARPAVSLKDDWINHFPSMATLEAYTTIPSYLFVRGFLKKTKGLPSQTPTSSSHSSSSKASAKSEITTDLDFSSAYSPLPDDLTIKTEHFPVEAQQKTYLG